MIDFNTILSAAITASINTAIEQAVAPLKAQIEKLEERLSATQAVLPVKFAAIAETASRLENNLTATNARVISAAEITVALNDQEWFWNKINNYVDQHMEARHPQPQQDTLSPEQLQQVRNIATELILNIDHSGAINSAFSKTSILEDAVDHYIRDYDFSDILADQVESAVENQLNSYDFREIVGDILEDARITL